MNPYELQHFEPLPRKDGSLSEHICPLPGFVLLSSLSALHLASQAVSNTMLALSALVTATSQMKPGASIAPTA